MRVKERVYKDSLIRCGCVLKNACKDVAFERRGGTKRRKLDVTGLANVN